MPSPRAVEVDEGLAGDLFGKAGATGALDAALPVEQGEGAEGDGLGPVPFLLDEAALARAAGDRLVLQRALAALVADRAVERMVDEEELEHALLRLARRRRDGGDLLPVGDRHEAGRLQGGTPRPGHLDEAHPAHAHRLHPRVVAKARDVDPGALGGLDDELTVLGLNGRGRQG